MTIVIFGVRPTLEKNASQNLFPNKETRIFDKKLTMREKFDIELLPEAIEFLDNLDFKAREKVYYNIKKSQFINDNELFKKINDNIWEFRTLYNKTAYRLLAFWDKKEMEGALVLATNGFIKKTEKTPLKEIEKAENIRKQYFISKNKKI